MNKVLELQNRNETITLDQLVQEVDALNFEGTFGNYFAMAEIITDGIHITDIDCKEIRIDEDIISLMPMIDYAPSFQLHSSKIGSISVNREEWVFSMGIPNFLIDLKSGETIAIYSCSDNESIEGEEYYE